MEKMMLETPPRPRMRASDSRPVLPIAFKAS